MPSRRRLHRLPDVHVGVSGDQHVRRGRPRPRSGSPWSPAPRWSTSTPSRRPGPGPNARTCGRQLVDAVQRLHHHALDPQVVAPDPLDQRGVVDALHPDPAGPGHPGRRHAAPRSSRDAVSRRAGRAGAGAGRRSVTSTPSSRNAAGSSGNIAALRPCRSSSTTAPFRSRPPRRRNRVSASSTTSPGSASTSGTTRRGRRPPTQRQSSEYRSSPCGGQARAQLARQRPDRDVHLACMSPAARAATLTPRRSTRFVTWVRAWRAGLAPLRRRRRRDRRRRGAPGRRRPRHLDRCAAARSAGRPRQAAPRRGPAGAAGPRRPARPARPRPVHRRRAAGRRGRDRRRPGARAGGTAAHLRLRRRVRDRALAGVRHARGATHSARRCRPVRPRPRPSCPTALADATAHWPGSTSPSGVRSWPAPWPRCAAPTSPPTCRPGYDARARRLFARASVLDRVLALAERERPGRRGQRLRGAATATRRCARC